MMRPQPFLLAALALASACGGKPATDHSLQTMRSGTPVAVRDTTRPDYFEASGVAEPMEQATLSTRLMATVTEVAPVEGAHVAKGDLLARIDARDLDAKRQQVTAAMADATAMHRLAEVTANRMRALYADSAAPRAQLDAAEAGLARAVAGLTAAKAAAAELEATARYSEIRAPFTGVITRRFVDPGAFAAPGAPLLTIESTGTLRVSVAVPGSVAASLRVGQQVRARIEGDTTTAKIEGVVPAGGNLFTVNALVPNGSGQFLTGSAATLLVPSGSRRVVLVPSAALVRQGDLTGVHRRTGSADELTWITVGASTDGFTEVLSGLSAGDTVLVSGAAGGS